MVGDIVSGPSNEQLFDSLRLGLKVVFEMTDVWGNTLLTTNVKIRSIERCFTANNETWKISFNYAFHLNQKYEENWALWEGVYSTKTRSGYVGDYTPINLHAALGPIVTNDNGSRFRPVYLPGTRKWIGTICMLNNTEEWLFHDKKDVEYLHTVSYIADHLNLSLNK